RWSRQLIDPFSLALLVLSLLILAQSLFALYLTLYSWEHPERLAASRGPSDFESARYSFSVLLPARHEERVIYETVLRVWRSAYSRGEAERGDGHSARLLEIIVICHADDVGTIAEAQRAADSIGSDDVRVVTFAGGPINKPHALNVGL